MNKVLIIGRIVRDPYTQQTASGIKYTRFTIAVNRQFEKDQADFIPIITWRNQANFVDKYMKKGSLISIEGRFNSNTYQNNENQTITRYEVLADRVQQLETKAQQEARRNKINESPSSTTNTMDLEDENTSDQTKESNSTDKESEDIPWELDL